MSDNKTLLINIKPKNDPEQLEEMLKEFEADDVAVLRGGVFTIPENNHLITDEGHLLIIFPDRIDFAVALEPDEFVIMGSK